MTPERHVLITGASGGIGRALALEYAAPETLLSLCGRRLDALRETGGLAEAQGARCRLAAFDVRDFAALRGFIEEAQAAAPLSLLFANAGVCYGTREDGLETLEECRETLEVNAEAAIVTALLGAKAMLPQKSGRIALVSSQAGKLPLVFTPSYCASKGAVRLYGLSLRESLLSRGIKVTTIAPGYVASPMSARFLGFAPWFWSDAKAARHVRRKLAKGPRTISFPFLMNALIAALPILPGPLRSRLLKFFSFKVAERS